MIYFNIFIASFALGFVSGGILRRWKEYKFIKNNIETSSEKAQEDINYLYLNGNINKNLHLNLQNDIQIKKNQALRDNKFSILKK